jgi:hypothetical protein
MVAKTGLVPQMKQNRLSQTYEPPSLSCCCAAEGCAHARGNSNDSGVIPMAPGITSLQFSEDFCRFLRYFHISTIPGPLRKTFIGIGEFLKIVLRGVELWIYGNTPNILIKLNKY